ncbi:3-oxoacyl-ACP reductase FabG [Natranaerofaba carboxydovora]|uniref:3-oxoacyl-ACP reductase FabG n=1 Tax=Natranaerofaba carboxydovora TaxID=2742683 RepID=UPI001F13977D|nr:3-oxoacyl-ACP reductase FabG [Natranaerofaba carboxydovora]UMZ74135.1 3-oxoacyl-[acyl-carrier-protein] reductase FabG [Natranaerofaba carboxydovora]
MRLKDKVAIITGGARGIGEETSKRFAGEGAKVVVVDLIDEADVVSEISKNEGEAKYIKTDVSDMEQVKDMVSKVKDYYGRIDILVNNAGITRDGKLKDISKEHWEQVVKVNLTGVFNCTQVVSEIMMSQGSGKIINASSVVGIYGNFGQTNYSATKAGVIGMTKSWAKELGRKGINVNAVAPGFVKTPMTEKVPEKVLTMMENDTPLKRLGTPRDIANAYLFLASDEADYINGTALEVTGGLTL